jgi:putative zinc finger protein
MAKNRAHPDKELFDYLSGALDAQSGQAVEQHLTDCAGCASVASLVRALKTTVGKSRDAAQAAQISNRAPEIQKSEIQKSEIAEAHPDASALASFFYSRAPRASNRAVAAHVALCQSCAEEIAHYARAERAASDYNSSQAAAGEVPQAAWEMIREWEESSFARPKAASETISHELLLKLSKLLGEQEPAKDRASEVEDGNMVPVIVVDREGEVRSVEMFKKARGAEGASILKHAEKSERFDNKPVHALLDFGENSPVVVSDRIRRDTVSLKQPARPEAEARRADYFIIED